MNGLAQDPAEPSIALSIGEVLRWQVLHRPNQRVFIFLERGEREVASLTFAELDSRARVIARALNERGLAGQRVILAYPSSLEFIASLFGCFYAGVIAVPSPVASRGYGAERLQAILSDSGAAAVLTLRAVRDQLRLRVDATRSATSSAELYLVTDELPDKEDFGPIMHPVPTDVALLQYTSGSTGNPRGVMLTHANVINNQRVLACAVASKAGETWVHWLPHYHDMGLIGGTFYPVYAGLTMCLLPPLAFLQKPIRWLQAIHRYRASGTMAPCFAFRLCAERGHIRDGDNLDLSCLRIAICGGEAVHPDWLEKFASTYRYAGFDSRAFLPAYGLAEATLMATASPAGQGVITYDRGASFGNDVVASAGWSRLLTNCGPAGHGQRIAIVHPASCRRVQPGDAGEIWLQGPSVAAGYWNRHDETKATFGAALANESEAGCWLRTGDIGFLELDSLVVTGRSKEIIVIRGANYDPLDIEIAAQESHDALASGGGGAFSIDTDLGEALVLVNEVRRTALRDLDVSALAVVVIEVISRRFGLTLHDLVLIRPGTLPRTTSGKIQRGVCRQQYNASQLATLDKIELPMLGRSRLQSRSLS